MKIFALGARADEVPIEAPAEPTLDADKGEKIQVPDSRRARRKMFRCLGDDVRVPGFAPISADTNDPQTVACGFKKRICRDVPSPKPGELKQLSSFVKRWLDEHLPAVQPWDFERWLLSTSYNEARKEELRRAHASLRGGVPSKADCTKLNSFVKSEGYDEYKWPRLINSRSDKFKVWAGPAIKAVEEVVYKLPEFVKHTPVPERAMKVKSLKQAGLRYFQTDFTAFESHFDPAVMEALELQLYKHCLPSWGGINLYCKTMTGLNHMRVRRSVTAVKTARRMSGDMCTSLGNGFSNLMLALYLADKHQGKLNGFVEGDDGIFATDFELLEQEYADLGFTIKCQEISDPCTASFCGMVFAESGQILRDPRHFLANFAWTTSYIHAGPRIMSELLKAKALSAAYETPNCPIVTAMVSLALEKTQQVDPRFVYDGYHSVGTTSRPGVPNHDTRELFARLYGIQPDAQEEIERLILAGRLDKLGPFLRPTPHMAHYEARYVQVG